jgi:hypothetical protein
MATAVQTPPGRPPAQPSLLEGTAAAVETAPAAARVAEAQVYWGDRLALKVWAACWLFMWVIGLLNLLWGLWS